MLDMKNVLLVILVSCAVVSQADTNDLASFTKAQDLRASDFTDRLWDIGVSSSVKEIWFGSDGSFQFGTMADIGRHCSAGTWKLDGNLILQASTNRCCITNSVYRLRGELIIVPFPAEGAYLRQTIRSGYFYRHLMDYRPKCLTNRWSELPSAGAAGSRSP